MRILMIGDIIGQPGRKAVRALLPELKQELQIDLVIANGENTAGGFGITQDTAYQLLESGVDILTSGNHIWDQKEIIPIHGRGSSPDPSRQLPRMHRGGATGLKGCHGPEPDGQRVYANTGLSFSHRHPHSGGGSPNRIAQRSSSWISMRKATSEKQAMGWYLDGRVSAVLGTHTHVGTVDTRVLPRGTAYLTDVGMTGPMDSVIAVTPTRFSNGS